MSGSVPLDQLLFLLTDVDFWIGVVLGAIGAWSADEWLFPRIAHRIARSRR